MEEMVVVNQKWFMEKSRGCMNWCYLSALLPFLPDWLN